jgi:hypothetical protein
MSRSLLTDERGDVAFSYLVVTYFMLLLAAAVVGLIMPLARENNQAELMLVENNP